MESSDVLTLISQIEQQETMDLDLLSLFIKSVATRNIDINYVEQWLKAVHSNGISVDETTILTKGMMESGSIIAWEDNTLVVDKHSTGGVGDKMSLMLAPALAACGLKVPMLAGRGLGHTGGTIDKLESINGFNCSLNPQQMQDQVAAIGCCIAAQNTAIAPADGLLYAVRDVTDTIDSIPLITASIISKKAAEGLGSLVLDVKCGQGAFMQSFTDAEALAKSMVGAAQGLGINTIAQITQMDYPIGRYVGNSLEILGSIAVLKGQGSSDTRELVILQGAALLVLSGTASDEFAGQAMMNNVLDNGGALAKFKQMCLAQGVSQTDVELLVSQPTKLLDKSKQVTSIYSPSQGYVSAITSMTLAEIARNHGAGRFALEDTIIPEIGFEILVERGQAINQGEAWIKFHHNVDLTAQEQQSLTDCITISSKPIKSKPRLIEIIR
ncbi:thymidine phosphorylase [bacterium]|nr:thymidine phosphorylase [bacterium]